MGREIHRVPLDFDWPIGQTWISYAVKVNFPACPDCTYEATERCPACWHTPERRGTGWSPRAWELKHSVANKGRNHDRDVVALADAEGWDAYCARCGGHGDLSTEELRWWVENMPSTPIPKGDGWQLWETAGDSPMSPVFATADELAEWMALNPWRMNPSLSDPTPLVPSTLEEAKAFIGVGSAPSFVFRDGTLTDGVAAAIGGPVAP